MGQLPTSKGTPRAQKQNLDKSHEKMATKQKLMLLFFISKGAEGHHCFRINFGTHYSKFKKNTVRSVFA